jgi:glycosyltransferase involved in cell wall biosynthesis
VNTARILKVVPTLMCGGTENQFMTLGRLLDRSHFDLEFACLRRWGPFVDELARLQIPLAEYQVSTFRSVHSFRQQAKLARHIGRSGVQIVHAYNFYGNVFAIPPARLTAPVVIASIRDRAPYLTPMQKRVQRYACQFADCVLVNADAVKDWLIGEGYDPSNIVVIRNGVDMSRFAGPPARERRGPELGGPAGTALVRLIFTGLRSDVPAVLGAATVAVMPSLNEALSNVLLESMAAGAPVVATRVGGTPEALVDGETGLLVPPGDAGAIAAGVARLLDQRDLARRLGCGARALIASKFSVERMVRSTEQLYMDLLARKQRKAAAA